MSWVTSVEAYVAHRRAMGYALKEEGKQLQQFAQFADQQGHPGPLTLELAVRWAKAPTLTPIGQARRLAAVRNLAHYLIAFEPLTEIPPVGWLGPLHHGRRAYIYSDEQIQTLLDAASHLPPEKGLFPMTMQTLFGLLAATGLRISEALRLTMPDVDLIAGVLTIRHTKFAQCRYVPLHPTATAALVTYTQARRPYSKASDHFFITDRGRALSYTDARKTFRQLRHQLGWQATPSSASPRIHDLRHTFACRRLLAWYQTGVDIDHAIASLSMYLGHVRVHNTYWYLSSIPELMAVTASAFEAYVDNTEGLTP